MISNYRQIDELARDLYANAAMRARALVGTDKLDVMNAVAQIMQAAALGFSPLFSDVPDAPPKDRAPARPERPPGLSRDDLKFIMERLRTIGSSYSAAMRDWAGRLVVTIQSMLDNDFFIPVHELKSLPPFTLAEIETLASLGRVTGIGMTDDLQRKIERWNEFLTDGE